MSLITALSYPWQVGVQCNQAGKEVEEEDPRCPCFCRGLGSRGQQSAAPEGSPGAKGACSSQMLVATRWQHHSDRKLLGWGRHLGSVIITSVAIDISHFLWASVSPSLQRGIWVSIISKEPLQLKYYL